MLEAKQSKRRQRAAAAADPAAADLFGADARAPRAPGRGLDEVMIEARRQAENYARALPIDHGFRPLGGPGVVARRQARRHHAPQRKSKEQEAAEEELIGRIVALKKERAAEEKRCVVRWLRPDYQIPCQALRTMLKKGQEIDWIASLISAMLTTRGFFFVP